MNPSDEIKSRLDIVDLIREYINLKPAGSNFRAPCPFHNEKSPSFMVSPEKQIWHCVGCGKGGDVISFVQEIEGLDFLEALRILAPKAGVVLRQQNPREVSKRNRLLDIMDEVCGYYERCLWKQENNWGLEYLKDRGLDDKTIKDWRIGLSADSWDDVVSVLKAKGFSENEMIRAGLIIRNDNSGRLYNRFRDRIMFPIMDVNGNVVAFSARMNPAKEETEKSGKYINSPQTDIYDKSKIVFGLHKAKLEIKKADYAIIMEGQMDVITAHQAGFYNAVASSGTAMTADHVHLIKRYTQNLLLAFDMDSAGRMAVDRAAKVAWDDEMNVKVIILPAGKDPDECIRKTPDLWISALKDTKELVQYYFDEALEKTDLTEAHSKRELAVKLLSVIARIKNGIEQGHWLRKLANILDVDESYLRGSLPGKPSISPRKSNTPVIEDQQRLGRFEQLSELLIVLMLKFPGHIDYVVRNIPLDHIIGIVNKTFYKNLILYYNENSPSMSYDGLKSFLSKRPVSDDDKQAQFRVLDRLTMIGDRDYYNVESQAIKKELINIIKELKKHNLKNRMIEIQVAIDKYEKQKDYEKVKALMMDFKLINDEYLDISK